MPDFDAIPAGKRGIKYEYDEGHHLSDYQWQPRHIHTPCDGRGARRVYIDGVKVDRVFYADTQKGYARYYLLNEEGNPYDNRRHTGTRWAKKRGQIDVRKVPSWELLYSDLRACFYVALHRLRLLCTGWVYEGNGMWSKPYR